MESHIFRQQVAGVCDVSPRENKVITPVSVEEVSSAKTRSPPISLLAFVLRSCVLRNLKTHESPGF